MSDGTENTKSPVAHGNPFANASTNEQSQCAAAKPARTKKKRTISHNNPHAKYSYVMEKGELLSVKPTSITGFIVRWHATGWSIGCCNVLCCACSRVLYYIRFSCACNPFSRLDWSQNLWFVSVLYLIIHDWMANNKFTGRWQPKNYAWPTKTMKRDVNGRAHTATDICIYILYLIKWARQQPHVNDVLAGWRSIVIQFKQRAAVDLCVCLNTSTTTCALTFIANIAGRSDS